MVKSVSSCCVRGRWVLSNPVTYIPLMYVGLPAPTNVKAKVLTPNSVKVTWNQLPEIAGYLISCTSPASYAGNKNVIVCGGDTTSHELTKLEGNTPYEISVQGLTSDGRKSDPSTGESIITQKAGKCYILISYQSISYVTIQLLAHLHRILRYQVIIQDH